MNRMILAAGLVAVAVLSVSSCSDDSICDLQCPPDDPGDSHPIQILVLTAFAEPSILDSIPSIIEDSGQLPEGSGVDKFAIFGPERELRIPELDYLQQYDAAMVLTLGYPLQEDFARYDTIGNLLADYVDDGGGLVMFQYSMYDGAARIQGRICSPGYSPYKATSYPDRDNWDARSIDIDSIDFPLHPVFDGIDIDELMLPGDLLADPELEESAVLLASDDRDTSVIAINTSGNVIGYNVHGGIFTIPGYEEAMKLGINALLYVANHEESP